MPCVISKMAKRVLLFLTILGFALKCSATVYTVGDSSGWDISTDLDSWEKTKTFLVGDVLFFQYSSYHSVSEVTQPNYEGCNTTNVLQTSSNGNTSFAMTNPGDRYFVCGNRLHCLGGMKLHAHVQDDQAASPAYPPVAESGNSLPPASTKSYTPFSSAPKFSRGGIDFLSLIAFLGLSSVLFGVF